MKTHEGANAEYSTGNPLVEFFSKAGSLFEKRGSFYGNQASALDLFKNAWSTDKSKAIKLLFWLRNPRGGAGNRSGFRSIIKWLSQVDPSWINVNIPLIQKYGRWDDLVALMDTPSEEVALYNWGNAISNQDGNACKWAPRDNKQHKVVANKLRKSLNLSNKAYRKLIVKGTQVVENKMCNKKFNEIEYSHVPSVAMARYKSAFNKNDSARFSEYIKKVDAGESKINAGVLFPHDIIRGLGVGGTSEAVANAQFKALPDFFSTDERVISIVDSSGSMICNIGGSVNALDVAMGLGFYCSDRLGEGNPFYRKFIPFSNDASFFNWIGLEFAEGVRAFRKDVLFGKVCSTNLSSAFKLILDTATFMNVKEDQMPTTLIIISDMQFHQGAYTSPDRNETEMSSIKRAYEAAGYKLPKIVYWNTAGYAGSPDSAFTQNVGFVSGFSPSILNAVFSGEDFSPVGIMNKELEKYNDVTIPE